ncbi:MAG: hypothetical protein RML84_11280 [Anaerolineae bacterium]|nr:hypothetical protein [Anaerolineae bacterium]
MDNDETVLYVDIDELAIIARNFQRTETWRWALNAAIAALDPANDQDLILILEHIRDGVT